MIKDIFFLFAGLLLLFLSGKYLVESSVAIARLFRIPTMVIGLTVVAMGTSAPELLVSLQAAIRGFPEIAMGNVVGSNISNVLLVLAITAIIYPVPVPEKSVKRDWPMMMLVSSLLFLFVLDGRLSRIEGGIFLMLLIAYIIYSLLQARRSNRLGGDRKVAGSMRWYVAVVIFLISCGGLALGADLLVRSAASIAGELGISKRVISVTMVAVGTSIPELVTSVIAAIKKESGISLGNIIGSNIMNIISVLGITSMITPIRVEDQIARFDIPCMIAAAVILLLFMLPALRSRITRGEGIFMVLIYLLYIYFIF
jgi:cation:H+ antiporter